jgi:hypothetical protein
MLYRRIASRERGVVRPPGGPTLSTGGEFPMNPSESVPRDARIVSDAPLVARGGRSD